MIKSSDKRAASTDGVTHETWNSPAQIARHRAMTPQERLRKAIALSQAAIRFSRAERVDD